MTLAELIAQARAQTAESIRLAVASKMRSRSTLVDIWQDQIVGAQDRINGLLDQAGLWGAGLSILPHPPLAVYIGETQQFRAVGWPGGLPEPVVWSCTGGTITQDGLFTAGQVEGSFIIRAVSMQPPGQGAMLLVNTVRRGQGNVPSFLSITTQPSSAPINRAAFVQQPVIQLRDNVGLAKAVAGVVVTAAIYTGGGTLTGTATAVTDASGVATFAGLAIQGLIGARTLIFTATGYSSVVSAVVTTTPAAATAAVVTTQPAGAVDGTPFTTQPVFQLADVDGNLVSTGTIDVVVTKFSGSGTLGGTATKACVNGVAAFTNLQITGTGTPVVLRATPTGLIAVDCNPITVGSVPPPGGLYPNRPVGHITIAENILNVPVPPPGADAGYAFINGGSTGWKAQTGANPVGQTVPGSSGMYLVTDGTEQVWEVRMPAGSYGGGVVGQGGGSGFGDFGVPTPSFKSELYCEVELKYDSDFERHPVSNKFGDLTSSGLQLLTQSWEGGWPVLNPATTAPGWRANMLLSAALTLGVWHTVEWVYNYGLPGRVRVWLDGILICDEAGQNIPASGGWQDMNIRNFRGGGGETKTRNSYIRYRRLYLSGKA